MPPAGFGIIATPSSRRCPSGGIYLVSAPNLDSAGSAKRFDRISNTPLRRKFATEKKLEVLYDALVVTTHSVPLVFIVVIKCIVLDSRVPSWGPHPAKVVRPHQFVGCLVCDRHKHVHNPQTNGENRGQSDVDAKTQGEYPSVVPHRLYCVQGQAHNADGHLC